MAECSADILVAEDEPSSARLMADLLAMAGYTCRIVPDGNSLMEEVRAQAPDLILLDVRIPGRNGFEVCERLKASPITSTIPIMMVTALAEEQWRLRAIEAGADDYVTKPVKRAELYARIRALVRMRRRLGEFENPGGVVESLFRLIALHDPALARHSQRVADLAGKAASRIGMEPDEVRLIQQAGLLHDLGKVPGGPPDEHPRRGEEAVSCLGALARLAPLIRSHHEHYDGSGMPGGLTALVQPLPVQLLAAANAWEHILSQSDDLPAAAAELQRQVGLQWWNASLVEPLVQAAEELQAALT